MSAAMPHELYLDWKAKSAGDEHGEEPLGAVEHAGSDPRAETDVAHEVAPAELARAGLAKVDAVPASHEPGERHAADEIGQHDERDRQRGRVCHRRYSLARWLIACSA